jgi:hypothetical protein
MMPIGFHLRAIGYREDPSFGGIMTFVAEKQRAWLFLDHLTNSTITFLIGVVGCA